MPWYQYKPYVPVSKRREQAAKAAAKMAKNGRKLEPVEIEGRTIAKTFWGKAWCDNLEAYSDYANRLPRGRTYVRNGSVIDLQISPGRIEALIQGSELYKANIVIQPLPAARWKAFVKAATGQVSSLFDLLQGRLSKDLIAAIADHKTGLFPSPKEIKLDCDCPDWAGLCKHLASVMYGVGARLDDRPELFFTLRGVDMKDLVAAAGTSAAEPLAGDTGFDGADLSAIFGVEIETEAPAPKKKAAAKKKTAAKKKAAAKKKTAAKKEAAAKKKTAAKKVAAAKKKTTRKR